MFDLAALRNRLRRVTDSGEKASQFQPSLVVFGVGGAGCNAITNMIRSGLTGVKFIAANTDAQALNQSLGDVHVQLGRDLTQGLGAGSRPDIGRAAAEETLDEIKEHLRGAHMAFITAGLGGGTGTGAAPVIARAARRLGVLTVAVVTLPFEFEGPHRMRVATAGLKELGPVVDTLIDIPNQRLFNLAQENTTVLEAFAMADDVLRKGVGGLINLMVRPGVVNLDFADIRTVMRIMGKAAVGVGEASGPGRAREAADLAVTNPLLANIKLESARGVIVNVTGGKDTTIHEINEAVARVLQNVDSNANLIFGSALDKSMRQTLQVTLFATGIGGMVEASRRPTKSVTEPPSERRAQKEGAAGRGATTTKGRAKSGGAKKNGAKSRGGTSSSRRRSTANA